jgi:hypothetical protein
MAELNEVEAAARDAFDKAEYVRNLSIMNTPVDHNARRKAFVELAKAKALAHEAELKLQKLL